MALKSKDQKIKPQKPDTVKEPKEPKNKFSAID